MNTTIKTIIWEQFGAAIDMLENDIVASPEEVWGDRSGYCEFWYLAYHTLFFLDYYMSESSEGFAPLLPLPLANSTRPAFFPIEYIQRMSFSPIWSTAATSARRGLKT